LRSIESSGRVVDLTLIGFKINTLE
jgi:hypothetical protein